MEERGQRPRVMATGGESDYTAGIGSRGRRLAWKQVNSVHVGNLILTGQSNEHLRSAFGRVGVGHREVTGATGQVPSRAGSTVASGRREGLGSVGSISRGATGRGTLSSMGPQGQATAERWGLGAHSAS